MKIIVAFLLLATGVTALHYLDIGYLKYTFLAITGFAAYWTVFGSEGVKNLFQKPQRFIRYGIVAVIYAQLYGFASAMGVGVLSQLLNETTKANAAAENPWWFFITIMPIALIGEEIFSITILDSLKKIGVKPLLASVVSAVVFGMIHYFTYLGSSSLLTIIQILAVQGGLRLIFNHSYQKSRSNDVLQGSITTSWTLHFLYDLLSFGIGYIL